MLTLTTKAHEALRLISRSSTPTHVPGLRISRSGDRPTFTVRRALAPEKTDQVVEHNGARVFLGPVAARRFADSELDVRTDARNRLEFVVRDRPTH